MDVIPDLDCQYVEEHDLVSKYLAGRLTEQEAEAFEKHYFGCERCWGEVKAGEEIRAALKGGAAAEPDVPLSLRRGPWGSWRVLAIAAAVAVAVLAGVLVARSRARSDVATLAAALDFKSPVEGRLTSFGNGPRQTERSAAPSPPSGRALETIGRIQTRAEKDATAANVAALGVARLVLGDPEGAVASLEDATQKDPQNGRYWNDLAAAYIAAGQKLQQPELIGKALSCAERALSLDPSDIEALFNRALALELVPLKAKALQAWQDYLRKDSTSPWAKEAEQHRQRLTAADNSLFSDRDRTALRTAAAAGDRASVEAIVRRFPASSAEFLETELLPEWATARLTPSAPRRPLVPAMTLIADAHAAVTGDPMLRQTIEIIEHAGPDTDLDLARGHSEYRDGKRLYDADEMVKAAQTLERAEQELGRARSPYSNWARFYAITSRVYEEGRGGSVADLRTLETLAEQQHFALLRARIRWVDAWSRAADGDLTSAVDGYLLALENFERVGDPGDCAVVHSRLAEIYDFLGDSRTAWTHRQQALGHLPSITNPVLSHSVLVEATYAALSQNLDWLAFHCQTALESQPLRGVGPTAGSEDELLLAQIQKRLGKTEVARGSLIRARNALSSLSDPDLARRANAEIAVTEGEVDRQTAPRVSVASLTRAVDYFKASNGQSRLPELYLERGRAQLALGRSDLAEEDFAAGIKVFEEQRSLQAEFQVPYFERAWDLFDEMIRLEAVVKHGPDKALAYAERGRARDLLNRLDGLQQNASNPRAATRLLDPSEIQSELSDGLTLVYYCSLSDRLLIWTLTKTGSRFFENSCPNDRLARLVDQYRSALQQSRPAEELDRRSAELYDLLIAPFAGSVPAGAVLVFLPHGPLHGLPFASLRSKGANRYLVQDHVIGVAPSGNVFVHACRRMRALGRPTQLAVLAVGNPRIDQRAFPGLPDLPEARAEAREVGSLYAHSELLTDADATPSRFWTAAASSDVIHYAGHAWVNPLYPSLSRLMFAADGSSADHGVVFAKQLYEHPLSRTQLAVLAGCETGSGPPLNSEGVMSLARPFLAAGVPQVVASLWRVDDRASRELLSRFHRHIVAGSNASSALRQAQGELIKATDANVRSPAAWAAFEVLGAATRS